MWKLLLNLFKGKKEEPEETCVQEPIESEMKEKPIVDSNPMFSKLVENEYEFLSLAQGELSKAHRLLSQGKYSDVRDVLKPLGMLVRTSLITNYGSEQYEKLLDIIESSTLIADTYIKEDDYEKAYNELNNAKTYADELTMLASNRQGTLRFIIHMYCMYLECCHKLGREDGRELIINKIGSVIAILASCMSRSSVTDKIKSVERICDYVDELITMEAYKDACAIYLQVFSSIKWEELDDHSLKHSYAILYGRYVRCLLDSSPVDMDVCMNSCVSEVEMYEELLEEEDSIQAKMDLAVAYSHLANCYSLTEDYPNFVTSHVRKIVLLTDAIKNNLGNEDNIYNNKRLSDSIGISIKNCVNEFGEVNSSNVNFYKEIFNALKIINGCYMENSELLAYINLIAGELFKYINDNDFILAQDCLITRFTSLLYLLNNYGPEDNIVKDFADTIVYAQPFIIENKQTINDDLRELWNDSYSKAKEIFNL